MRKTAHEIPIAKPWITDAEIEHITRAVRSGWISQGPEVAKFEEEFASFVGAPHACAVSSCTTALHLALKVAGVGPQDEVLTVSHSFIATANSIRYLDAVPVFIDVEPDTYNINPRLLEKRITKRTRAILCVHQMGMPCDLSAILEIAGRHALPVIEDAACAAGSEISREGRFERIGKPHGAIACFSFHPRKVMTTGDGGMLTTANPEWDRAFRLLRQHGMNVSDRSRHESREVVFESYEMLGYNYRMTDLSAALGRAQLEKLPEMVRRRRNLADRYAEKLGSVKGLRVPKEPDWARSNWQSYCVRLPETCDQLRLMQWMLDHGVATRRGVHCAHEEPAYGREIWSCGEGPDACGCLPKQCRNLKESETAHSRSLLLPLYPQMTDAEQDYVIQTLLEGCRRA